MLTYHTLWRDWNTGKGRKTMIVYLSLRRNQGSPLLSFIILYNLNCIFCFDFWGHKIHIMCCLGGMWGYTSIVKFRYYYIILCRCFVTLVSWTKYNVVLIQPGIIVYVITYFNTIYYNMHIIFNILGIIYVDVGRWTRNPVAVTFPSVFFFFGCFNCATTNITTVPRPPRRRPTHSTPPTRTQRTRLNINCDHPVSKRWSETNTVAAREDKTF